MISIQRFNYAGYSSEDFDLCCQLSFDDNSGEVSTFLSREAVASETYRGEIQKVSSYKYTDVLAPTITLTDKDFGEFDLDRQRKIMRWLTSKNVPSFITIYHDDSNVVSYEILGAFTEISTYKNGSGRVIGFTAVAKSISPFAYSALQTITKTITGTTNNTFNIEIDSDEEESEICPRITIQQNSDVVVYVDHTMINGDKWINNDEWLDGVVYYYSDEKMYYYQRHYIEIDSDGNTREKSIPTATQTNPITTDTKTGVIIRNTYADNNDISHVTTLRIANNTANEKVIIDGANNVVSSSATSRILGDNFNWEWLPLYNGKNTIEIIGNCTVTFEYRTVVKCGEM